MEEKTYGYHLRDIKKGILGDTSKIREELEELEDAMDQKCKVMALCEISDLYGAIEAFLLKHFPDINMQDLEKMAQITRRAFASGRRK